MAVAIPIIMAVGFEATAATIIATSLVLTATGANAKINAEASKVFGKDVVSLANIAGAVYLAGSGGSAGGGSEEAVSGMDLAADAGQGATGANGITEAANSLNGGAAGTMGTAQFGSAPPADLTFSDAGQSGFNVEPLPGSDPTAVQFGGPTSMQPGALSQAAGSPAPGQVTAPAAPSVPGNPAAVPKPTSTGGVDLLSRAGDAWKNLGDRGQGALIQVAGGVMQGYGQAQTQQALLDQQRANDAKYRSGSGLAYWQAKPSYTKPGG